MTATKGWVKAPTVTLFNGTGAVVRDETCAPYLTGLKRASHSRQASLEPVISVVGEGSRIELQAEITEPSTLELNCRATFSDVYSVYESPAPRTDQLLQVPNVTELVFEARGCRFSPGQSLVVAPIARLQESGGLLESMCFALTPTWSPATSPRHDVSTEPTTYIDETNRSF